MSANVTLEERPAQPYLGIRAGVTMAELGEVVPPLWPEVFGWMAQHGVAPAGPPILRYLVVEMAGRLEVEAGVPVEAPVEGDSRVRPGTLPAGRYAVLTHVGDPLELVAANGALQDWCRERALSWPMYGERWLGRVEAYHTDPREQPDRSQWETEIDYLVAR